MKCKWRCTLFILPPFFLPAALNEFVKAKAPAAILNLRINLKMEATTKKVENGPLMTMES